MEVVKDVLFGVGGVVVFLAFVAGIVAVLVAINATARFLGRVLARKYPKLNIAKLCGWGYFAVAFVAMSFSFIAVNGTTRSVGAFVVVMVMKGVMGLLVAGIAAFLANALVGQPLQRSFVAERMARGDQNATLTYA